jgi:hypothetical protein
MPDHYLQDAFSAVCKDAKQATGHYVCLMEQASRYGGPEEGGWWATDTTLVAYQRFDTAEDAEAARAAVESLAVELSEQSRKSFGEQCLREMEWLEERGLDADYLPEPDGESSYTVIVTDALPTNSYGPNHYE